MQNSTALAVSTLNDLDLQNKFLIGSDPEVFIKDKKGNYVSAIGKFPGTKEVPCPVRALGKGFAIQVDNVLLEYNIPAATNLEKWMNSHKTMLDHLFKITAEKELEISIDAAAEMPEKELQDPMARVFGCEPDFNAWDLTINTPPKSDNPNLRSAGGHIHIGLDMTDIQKINLVRFMDMVLGAWSICIDTDTKRKELYGRPGAMRFKPYGLEYRTISNFWLKDLGSIVDAYNLVQFAVKRGRDFKSGSFRDQVMAVFKHNDKAKAKTLLGEMGVEIKGLSSV